MITKVHTYLQYKLHNVYKAYDEGNTWKCVTTAVKWAQIAQSLKGI